MKLQNIEDNSVGVTFEVLGYSGDANKFNMIDLDTDDVGKIVSWYLKERHSIDVANLVLRNGVLTAYFDKEFKNNS